MKRLQRVLVLAAAGLVAFGIPWAGGVTQAATASAHQHEFKVQVTREPSCGIPGSQVYICKGCNYSYSVRLSALRHAYRPKVTIAPTCKSAGQITFTCKHCGDSYRETIPPTSEHKPVKKENKTICNVCGKTLAIEAKKVTETNKETVKVEDKNVRSKETTKPASETNKEKTVTPKKKVSASKKKAASSKKKATKGGNAAGAAKPGNKTIRAAKGTAETKATAPKKTPSEKAREAAVEWAIGIANDNSFHYGRSRWAHHFGCYFCGTNQKKGSAKRRAGASVSACEKTYCCNPFVTAAFCHGAGAKEISCTARGKRINLANDSNKALKNKKAFKRVSKPSDIKSLEAGDILLTPTHAMLYAGDGKIVHAAHHDNGKKDARWNSSITHCKISDRQWKRVSKIYRYIGKGKF